MAINLRAVVVVAIILYIPVTVALVLESYVHFLLKKAIISSNSGVASLSGPTTKIWLSHLVPCRMRGGPISSSNKHVHFSPFSLTFIHCGWVATCTVEPLNKGHLGTQAAVPYSEVVPYWEVRDKTVIL